MQKIECSQTKTKSFTGVRVIPHNQASSQKRLLKVVGAVCGSQGHARYHETPIVESFVASPMDKSWVYVPWGPIGSNKYCVYQSILQEQTANFNVVEVRNAILTTKENVEAIASVGR